MALVTGLAGYRLALLRRRWVTSRIVPPARRRIAPAPLTAAASKPVKANALLDEEVLVETVAT